MSDIDWTCGGERLLRATLNEIELEELPFLIQTLNSFIDGCACGPVPRVVKIEIHVWCGCEGPGYPQDTGTDALICLDDSTELSICSETTVNEMLDLLYRYAGNPQSVWQKIAGIWHWGIFPYWVTKACQHSS